MRCEQTKAALEDFRRTGRALARQNRGGYPALCRPPRMEELGLGPVHPALQQAGCKASADARRLRHLVRIEPEQSGCEIAGPERRKQAGRMKAALMKLPGRHAADPAGNL